MRFVKFSKYLKINVRSQPWKRLNVIARLTMFAGKDN